MINYLHFTIRPEFPTSPFQHYGRPLRADRTPSAQNSRPGIKDRLRNFAQSERAGRVRERNALIHGNLQQCYPLWNGNYFFSAIIQPLAMEKEWIKTTPRHPDHPFYHHPFITFDETGWRIPSAQWSTWAAAGDVRAGTPGRGEGRKVKDSINT